VGTILSMRICKEPPRSITGTSAFYLFLMQSLGLMA
jgi:hypothetical protein